MNITVVELQSCLIFGR